LNSHALPSSPLSLLIFTVQQRPHGLRIYIGDLPPSPLQPASSTTTSMHLLALRTRLSIIAVANSRPSHYDDEKATICTARVMRGVTARILARENGILFRRESILIRACVIARLSVTREVSHCPTPSLARTSLTSNALRMTASLSKLQNRSTPAPAIRGLIHRLHLPDFLVSLNPCPTM